MIWASLLAWAGAFLINLLILPLVLRLAHRHQWYAPPDSRKIHTGLIPRMGGPGLFLPFILAVVLAALALPRLAGVRLREPRLIALFGGMTIVLLVGLDDDFKTLPAIWKFVLQLAAAAIITSGGFLIRSVTLPYLGSINLGLAAYPVTVVWLVGIANAVNLIDGMDGLAGGIGAFAAAAMGAIALLQGSTRGAVLAFALFGALLAFLLV